MEAKSEKLNPDLMEALGQIAREKSVDRQVLIETLEAGLLSAAKKKLGASAMVSVDFDPESGSISMKATMEVADDFDQVDRGYQMPLIEAKRIKPDARVGDRIDISLPISKFGRNAIQAAKQVLIQRVREAERDRVYDEYHERVGELVTGIVQQVERGNVIIQLDRAEAIMPSREQIARDRFRQGEHIRSMIAAVDRSAKGPQIVLSRTSVEFVLRLFESEVPEIADGVVEVRAVARESGARSKVAVVSNDDKVDAVGACVGIKGSRVQSIVRELNGERIDIVPWSSDQILYVSRALSPAKAKHVTLTEDGTTMRVVVEDDQLSLAIGKGGQNARLAAKLTGYKIDLLSEGEEARQNEYDNLLRVEVETLPGVGPKLAEGLIRAGIETAEELVATDLDALTALPGIAPKTGTKLQQLAETAIAVRREEVEEAAAAREAEEAAAREAEKAAAAEAAKAAAAEAAASAEAAATADSEAVEADADSAATAADADSEATEADADSAATEADADGEAPAADADSAAAEADADSEAPAADADSEATEIETDSDVAEADADSDITETDSDPAEPMADSDVAETGADSGADEQSAKQESSSED